MAEQVVAVEHAIQSGQFGRARAAYSPTRMPAWVGACGYCAWASGMVPRLRDSGEYQGDRLVGHIRLEFTAQVGGVDMN